MGLDQLPHQQDQEGQQQAPAATQQLRGLQAERRKGAIHLPLLRRLT